MLILEDFLGKGSKKLCYVHPDDPTKVVKVDRKKRIINARIRLFRRFIPELTDTSPITFENYNYNKSLKKYGDVLLEVMPKCYGIHETNLGPGLVVDRIIYDEANQTSLSLGDFLRKNKSDELIRDALSKFEKMIVENNISFCDPSYANFLVEKTSELKLKYIEFECIDNPAEFISLMFFSKRLYVRKKFKRLRRNMKALLETLKSEKE